MGKDLAQEMFGHDHVGGMADPFAAAVRATRMPMIICDALAADTPIIFANRAFLAATQYGEEDVLGRNCRFLQGPETDRATVARLAEAVRTRTDIHVEILNYRADGSSFWNALFMGPVADEGGEVRYFFGSQLDVTDRKEAELRVHAEKAAIEAAVAERTRSLQSALEAKNALLHEVDHRVKNNLQTIASLVAMESRGITDPGCRASFGRLRGRVEAVATVHRRLYEESAVDRFDVAGFAHALLDQLASALGSGVQIRIGPDPILVPAPQASPIALLLNELLIEAGATGQSAIGFTLERIAPARLRMTVTPAAPLASDGAPSRSLVGRLVRQLGGTLSAEAGIAVVELDCDAPGATGRAS